MNQITERSQAVVSVNLEKMPIYFLGSAKESALLHEEIIRSGKPLVLADKTDKGKGWKLSISPSAIYGLLTGFDQDVFAVIQYKLCETARKNGACPEQLTLWLSEFPRIMKLEKQGALYDRIRESVRRLSETTIYHENFVKVRTETLESHEYFQDSALKLIDYRVTRQESVVKQDSSEVRREYMEISIPEWLQRDINTNMTTAFDPELYFTLSGDRARRLYRFLEIIRYKKICTVHKEKILTELTLQNVSTNQNRNIKRAIDPLVTIGYLEAYQINENTIEFTFTDYKRAAVSFHGPKTEPLDYREIDLVNQMMEYLKDEKSRPWYSKLARIVPDQMIYRCLSLTKETEQFDGLKTTRGAVFTDHIKRECLKQNISLT